MAAGDDPLWLTSFEEDKVVRVGLRAGQAMVLPDIVKPTGIAAGAGAIWVVNHRSDAVTRLDPATGRVVATISLGERGPHGTCGLCAGQALVAEGAVWVALSA